MRRVSGPAASRLTASKQPFLKANCNLRSEPQARAKPPASRAARSWTPLTSPQRRREGALGGLAVVV